MKNTATLLINCPDRKGLVAAIADFLYQNNANILHADQHQDAENKLFLMRVEWDLNDFAIAPQDFAAHFAPIAERFDMDWQLKLSQQRPRVALMVSQYDHCLVDLLHRCLALSVRQTRSAHQLCDGFVERMALTGAGFLCAPSPRLATPFGGALPDVFERLSDGGEELHEESDKVSGVNAFERGRWTALGSLAKQGI